MTKDDLVREVAARTHQGLNLSQTKEIVQATLDTMAEALLGGDKVQIVGLFTASTKVLAERKSKNMHTGEEIVISSRTVPVFKATAEFKKRIAAAIPVK